MAKLTKQVVDAARPQAKDHFLWDDRVSGFGLRVTPGGKKSYILQYRVAGRQHARRLTIGRHGSPWTPDTARTHALKLLLDVKRGSDPAAEKERKKQEAVDLAFAPYVDTFRDRYLKAKWKDWQLGYRLLVAHAVPVLETKALPEIKRRDLTVIMDSLVDRPAMARLAHATLRKLFRFAVSRGDLERSPMDGAEAPPPVAARDRVLSDVELKALWTASDGVNTLFRGAVRLLIVTGQRREEVAGLKWAELDRAATLWTLPADRAKNGVTHLVPLSALAIKVLDDLAGGDEWPSAGLVFSTTGKTPISGFSKAKLALDKGMADALAADVPGWRYHDLRRTLATGLQRLGVRFEVTEAVLNHKSGARSGVAGVYQRHDWATEKREALDGWAAHIERLVG